VILFLELSDYIKLGEKDLCIKFKEENEKRSYYDELRSAHSRAELRATQNTDLINALAQQQKKNSHSSGSSPCSTTSKLKANSTSPTPYQTRSSTNSTPDSFDQIESEINKQIDKLKKNQKPSSDEIKTNEPATTTTTATESKENDDPLFDYKNRRNPSALYRYHKIETMRKELQHANSRMTRSHYKHGNHSVPPQAVLANVNHNTKSNVAPLQATVVKITKSSEAEQFMNYRLSRTPRVSISSDTKNSVGEMEIKVRSLLYRSTSSASFDGPFFDSISEIEKIRQQLRDEFTHIASGAGRPHVVAERASSGNNVPTIASANMDGAVLVPRLNSAQILNKINQTNVQLNKNNPNQKKSVSLDNYYYTQQLREKLKQIVKKQQLQYTTLSSQNKRSMHINESKDKLSIDDLDDNLEQQFNAINFTIPNNNETSNSNTNNPGSATSNSKTNGNQRATSRLLMANRRELLKSAVHSNNNNNSTTTNPSRINSSIRHLNPNQIAYVGSSHSYKLNYESKRSAHLRNVPMFISGKSYSIPDVKLNQIKLKP
jgi:hypothetical protein